jgi:hypothetical protein
MLPLVIAVLLVLSPPAFQDHSSAPVAKAPVVTVKGPTIVAFFPVTQSELDNDKDGQLSEAYDDFQYYAGSMGKELEKKGIAFDFITEPSFQLVIGKTVTTFRPKKGDCGFYLIAPGKEPLIEHGVMTKVELVQLADRYFKQPRSK